MTLLQQVQRTCAVFRKMGHYLRLSDHPAANYRDLKKRFSQELRRHLQIQVSQSGFSPQQGPVIYVCNHMSYLDIPLIMEALPEACFVSKAEVASWPLIGKAARRIGTVFVKREKKSSREGVRLTLAQALVQEKRQIIVFPSSTTSIFKTPRWRKGVFELAAEHQVPVVPLRLSYSPLREIAYIDDDNLMLHLFALVARENLQAHLEFAEPVMIIEPLLDCAQIKDWCEEKMATASAIEMPTAEAATSDELAIAT